VKIDDSEGFVDIELEGKPTVRLDLFIANDTFLDATEALNESSTADERGKAYTKAAADLGLGQVSSRTARAIADAVFVRMDALRKKEVSPEQTP